MAEKESEMTHTPEPWAIDPDERPDMEWNNHILDATGARVCFMAHDGSPTNTSGEANAHRIVACVNACRGIPTEKLREGMFSEWRDATRELMRLHPDCGSADGPIARIESKMRALLKELEP